MEMTQRLTEALEKLAAMKHPSVAGVLRRNRYNVEADAVAEVIAAYEQVSQ